MCLKGLFALLHQLVKSLCSSLKQSKKTVCIRIFGIYLEFSCCSGIF